MKKFRKNLKGGVSETFSSVDENITKKDVKPQRKGKKRRRLMIKSMFVMSIVFIMISVSYSWFTEADSSVVTGVSVSLLEPQNLTLSNLKVYGKLEPVAGDGKTFFVPGIGLEEIETETDETTDIQYVTSVYDKTSDIYKKTDDAVTTAALTDALVPNVRVIDFSLSMEGEAQTLYLKSGSAVTASSGSPAYLPGAIRVSFLKKNVSGEYEQLFIWIPDVTSTVDPDTPVLEDEYVFVTGTTAQGTATTVKINDTQGTATVSGTKYVWGEIEDDVTLGGVGDYRCVIWLDGNDRECSKDLIGKKVELALTIEPATQGT